jgi:hypothetical protein
MMSVCPACRVGGRAGPPRPPSPAPPGRYQTSSAIPLRPPTPAPASSAAARSTTPSSSTSSIFRSADINILVLVPVAPLDFSQTRVKGTVS